MATCARCGDDCEPGRLSPEYDYCQACLDRFEEPRENGVYVYWRNNNTNTLPAGYCVNSPESTDEMCSSQVKALAAAKGEMEKNDIGGLFHYRRTDSRWLIDEYLEAHPGIAEDVRQEREGPLDALAHRLPL